MTGFIITVVAGVLFGGAALVVAYFADKSQAVLPGVPGLDADLAEFRAAVEHLGSVAQRLERDAAPLVRK